MISPNYMSINSEHFMILLLITPLNFEQLENMAASNIE